MIRRIVALLFVAFPLTAGAQGPPVLQSGVVTPTHTAVWVTNGVIGDGGAAGGLVGTSLALGGAFPSFTTLGDQGPLSGILGPTSIDPYASLVKPFAQIAVTSDTATNTGAGSGIPAFGVYHKFGGTGSGGGARMGIWSDLVQDGNLPTNADPFQTGIFSNVWAKSGTNGGEFYGFAGQTIDDLNLVHYGDVGMELDLSLHQPGAQIKEGLGIGSVPLTSGPDLYQGSNYSAGLGIWAGGSCGAGSGAGGSACAGFSVGISFGRSDSYLGVASSGTLIQTTLGIGSSGNMLVGNGIDFGNLAVTGNYLDMGGKFSVDSVGFIHESTIDPEIEFNDTNLTVTTGGKVRLASIGAGVYQWQVNTAAGGNFSTINPGVNLGPDGALILPRRTVSSGSGAPALPTCNSTTKGEMFLVIDDNTAVSYNATIAAGGGTTYIPAMCDGSNWTMH